MDFTIQNGYDISGGGMAIAGDEIILKNLLLKDNLVDSDGAGLHLHFAKSIKLLNMTIVNNMSNSTSGAAVGIYYGNLFDDGNLSIFNCIVTYL